MTVKAAGKDREGLEEGAKTGKIREKTGKASRKDREGWLCRRRACSAFVTSALRVSDLCRLLADGQLGGTPRTKDRASPATARRRAIIGKAPKEDREGVQEGPGRRRAKTGKAPGEDREGVAQWPGRRRAIIVQEGPGRCRAKTGKAPGQDREGVEQ